MILKRRNFMVLAGLASLASLGGGRNASALEAAPDPRVSLIGGVRQGNLWQAGLAIGLDPGWKTYWRNPGDAGLPPEFDWSGSRNLKQVTLDWPAPKRFSDGGIETIGYERDVIFPLTLVPQDPALPVDLHLKLFFGLCHDVCVPASANATLRLATDNPAGAAEIEPFRQAVPKPGTQLVREIALEGAAISIRIADDAPLMSDVFVEGPAPASFARPMIKGRTLLVPVSNLKNPQSLLGQKMRLTFLSTNGAFDATALAGVR